MRVLIVVVVFVVTGVKQSQLLVPDGSLDLGLELDNDIVLGHIAIIPFPVLCECHNVLKRARTTR